MQAKKRLTPQEVEEIEKEEKSLPSLYHQSEVMGRELTKLDLNALSQSIRQQSEAMGRELIKLDLNALSQSIRQQSEAMGRELTKVDFNALRQALISLHALPTITNQSSEGGQKESEQGQTLSFSQETNTEEKKMMR